MNKYLVVLGSIVLGASMMTGCSSTNLTTGYKK